MSPDQATPLTWRRSTACVGESHCVEVADISDSTIGLRDSKAPAASLTFTKTAWRDFITAVKADRIAR